MAATVQDRGRTANGGGAPRVADGNRSNRTLVALKAGTWMMVPAQNSAHNFCSGPELGPLRLTPIVATILKRLASTAPDRD